MNHTYYNCVWITYLHICRSHIYCNISKSVFSNSIKKKNLLNYSKRICTYSQSWWWYPRVSWIICICLFLFSQNERGAMLYIVVAALIPGTATTAAAAAHTLPFETHIYWTPSHIVSSYEKNFKLVGASVTIYLRSPSCCPYSIVQIPQGNLSIGTGGSHNRRFPQIHFGIRVVNVGNGSFVISQNSQWSQALPWEHTNASVPAARAKNLLIFAYFDTIYAGIFDRNIAAIDQPHFIANIAKNAQLIAGIAVDTAICFGTIVKRHWTVFEFCTIDDGVGA